MRSPSLTIALTLATRPPALRSKWGSAEAQAPQPIIIDAGTQVIDLTAGHLSSADAERLSALGEPATAVVTAVTDVPVPQAALPGPTASLCDLSLQVTRSGERVYSA